MEIKADVKSANEDSGPVFTLFPKLPPEFRIWKNAYFEQCVKELGNLINLIN
jgi:hypothetical protein